MTRDHVARRLIERLAAGAPEESVVFDDLTALGESAVSPVVAELIAGRGWNLWTAVLSRLEVDDPVLVLAPLATHGDDQVASAAVHALGRCGDPRAVGALADAIESRRQLLAGLAALGNLGAPSGAALVRRTVEKRLGDVWSSPAIDALVERAAANRDPSDLHVVAEAALALARLGDTQQAPAAIALSRVGASLGSRAVPVREAAIAALDVSVGDGVAVALHDACRDPDDDIADSALRATLHLGRVVDVEQWLALASSAPERAGRIAWCLEQFTGEAPDRDRSLATWWNRRRDRYLDGTSYRRGQPSSPAPLLDPITGPRSRTMRSELRQMTGLSFLVLELDQPSPRERSMIEQWWQQHADAYPPGQLHRWGRSYDPGAVGEP